MMNDTEDFLPSNSDGPKILSALNQGYSLGKPGENIFVDPSPKKAKKPNLHLKTNKHPFFSFEHLKSVFKIIYQDKVLFVWALIFPFILCRLVMMNYGVVDYIKKQSIIRDRQEQIQFLISENDEITNEIIRLKKDQKFQRFIAREHLGVIGPGEYLILFAPGSVSSPK